jgi:hypothetical protein
MRPLSERQVLGRVVGERPARQMSSDTGGRIGSDHQQLALPLKAPKTYPARVRQPQRGHKPPRLGKGPRERFRAPALLDVGVRRSVRPPKLRRTVAPQEQHIPRAIFDAASGPQRV